MSGIEWLHDDSPIADPEGRGERAVRALRALKHPKSALPVQAFQLDPPFERIVRRIYGPTDGAGRRIVRTVYLQVGKGSRKTSLAAALALLHTFGPERVPGGQNFVAAADRNQARIAFEEAASIIEANPKLANAARPVDSKNRLIHLGSGSRFEAVSSDGKKKHGATPNFVLVDELWAHAKAELWHALRTGATKVAGSLLIVATTAGRGNESPDFPIYSYAKRVQSGEIDDPTFLPIALEIGDAIKEQAERLSDAQKQALRAMEASPEETGNLEASCRVEPGGSPLEYVVKAGGELTTKEVRSGSGVAFDYSLAFVYGTTRQPARDFFWSPYNAMRDDMQSEINDAIGKALE